MKRSPVILSATIAGLAAVLTYHTHGSSFASVPGTSAPVVGHRASGTGASAASAGSGAGAPAGAGAGATSSTTPGPTPALSRQVTGPLVPYGYGELAVKVSLDGSKITNVSVTGLRTAEQYSQSLAQQVIPMLQSQVLQAQNANISGISGATYTSEAFASSLQKALKKVGV